MALSTVLSAWLRCKEHAAIPFWASLGAVAANTGLNYLLIFGKLGFAPMGVQGAAIATLVSQMLNFLLILLGFVVCLRRDGSHPLWTLHFERITLRAYGGMILPILLSEFLWSLGQNVESAVYGHLGTANLAAYTLTCPIQSLIVGALSGLSAAAGVMVGKHLGKKTYDAAYGDARLIMLTGLVGAIGIASLLVLFAGAYTNLYRVDADVQTLGKALLVVFALYAPVKVENMILSGGILRSGGNTRVIMIIDTIGTWGIGIPLCLGFYELLPFWWAFWTKLGFAVHTSPVSSRGLYLAGQATIPSDTACFPAKLSHGHIKALSQMELDAIFYPCLTYNVDEGLGDNHYNCPVVAYYPEVLAGNCPELEGKKFIYDYVGIHRPKDFVHKMAKTVLPKYFGGISEKEVQEAADAAYAEYEAHMAKIRVKGSEIIDEARRQGKRIIVLAGRPYHVDPEVNHGIDRLITRHGAAVVTEDSISNRVQKFPTSVLNQWTYHSRLYAAAKYCTTQKDMDLVQLVSFGCGVDAITTDETREILQAGGKLYTQLKIDEITNLGAVNIRLRSLFAALDERDEVAEEKAAAKAEA